MVYLATQNEWPSVALPSGAGRAWSMGGFGLSSPYRTNETLQDWLLRDDQSIRDRLERYLNKRPSLVVEQGVPVILDMESPMHLIHMGRHIDRIEEVVPAFARRARLAKELLPLARTLWWGWAPKGRGQTTTGYVRRMLGYWQAKDLGLWGVADGVALILYATEGDSKRVASQIRRAVDDASDMMRGSAALWPVITARARNGDLLCRRVVEDYAKTLGDEGLLDRSIVWSKKDDQGLAATLIADITGSLARC